MPLQSWLPAGHGRAQALSAVSGVFGVLRVTGYVFGPEGLAARVWTILAWFAAEKNRGILARLTAGRSQAAAHLDGGHLSYIVLGAAILTAHGGRFGDAPDVPRDDEDHVVLLHRCTCGRIRRTSATWWSIGRQCPVTMAAFAIERESGAGWRSRGERRVEYRLGYGGERRAGVRRDVGVVRCVERGVLLSIVHQAFFRKNDEFASYGEASMLMLVLTALISLVLGISSGYVHALDLAVGVAHAMLGGCDRRRVAAAPHRGMDLRAGQRGDRLGAALLGAAQAGGGTRFPAGGRSMGSVGCSVIIVVEQVAGICVPEKDEDFFDKCSAAVWPMSATERALSRGECLGHASGMGGGLVMLLVGVMAFGSLEWAAAESPAE